MAKKPTPKTVKVVCSLCGLDWGKHGENPTTEKCVELLLAEIQTLHRQRGQGLAQQQVRLTHPPNYPQSYIVPNLGGSYVSPPSRGPNPRNALQ